MRRLLQAALFIVPIGIALLGLWGLLANLAIPWMPGYGEFMPPATSNLAEPPGAASTPVVQRPWWAISFQTPCPYLDPCLAGPIGNAFYALCLSWGAITCLLLRSSIRAFFDKLGCLRILYGLWLVGSLGIGAILAFFARIVIRSYAAGLF